MEQSKWSRGVASGVASGNVGMDPNEFSTTQSTNTLIEIKV